MPELTGAATILTALFVGYSIVLHEIAHGYAAFLFGDETAKSRGRLSLNPITHIDPIGTIVFPALQVLVIGQFLIGWAKPVPVVPANYTRRVLGDIVVSLAGIVVNLDGPLATEQSIDRISEVVEQHRGDQHFHMDIEDDGDWFRVRSDTGVRITEHLIDDLANEAALGVDARLDFLYHVVHLEMDLPGS